MTEAERNRQVIRDLYAAADAGDLEAVLGCYSPSYLDHDASEARRDAASHHAALRPAFSAFYRAFRDTRHTLDECSPSVIQPTPRGHPAIHRLTLLGELPASSAKAT